MACVAGLGVAARGDGAHSRVVVHDVRLHLHVRHLRDQGLDLLNLPLLRTRPHQHVEASDVRLDADREPGPVRSQEGKRTMY